MAKLTKSNCVASKANSGHIYITHPESKLNLRLYCNEEELIADKDWRDRVVLKDGEYGMYAFLAKEAMKQLDV